MNAIAAWFAALFARPPGASMAEGPRPPDPLPIPVLAIGDPDWPAILRAAGFAQPEMWAQHIAGPARRFGITAGKRAAAFAATNAHESAGGTRVEENLRYSARRLTEVWPSRFRTIEAALPFAWDPTDPDLEDKALANLVYGARMGNQLNGTADDDGWDYRGRGLTQLTGQDAYARASEALGLPLLQQPDLAAQPNCAATIACWVWAEWKRCNPLADAGDVEGWRRAINGGLIGLEDVKRRYAAALRVT